ncbi:butyrate kinase [Candidatus Dependentiae bacterium]|nr:butyrate kinase [Candidatus Dependentiae bacterium]
MSDYILVINPGSTSTKYGLFSIKKNAFVVEDDIRHKADDLKAFAKVTDQDKFRKEIILGELKKQGFTLENNLSAVVGRGGLLHPLEGGTFKINASMLEDLRNLKWGEHASNLGALLADEIAKEYGDLPSFIVDSVSVDEFCKEAYISGYPKIRRRCRAHVLNIKAAARKACDKLNKKLEEINFVAVHIGGGISVVALEKGHLIDVNNALLGEGPFSPERAGTLPLEELIDICYSGEFTKDELKKQLTKNSGLIAYLGTNDGIKIENMVNDGDEKAITIFNAWIFQIAKHIGAKATVLKGEIEGIIITGGWARSKLLIKCLKERVGFLGELFIFPGQFEMEALAMGALRVLNKEETAKEYTDQFFPKPI